MTARNQCLKNVNTKILDSKRTIMKRFIDPTPDQVEWLKNNYRLYSNFHLAEKMGVTEHRVQHWLRLYHLRKRKLVPRAQSNKRVNKGIESTIKHPPGDHTNISREQHVERILNTRI